MEIRANPPQSASSVHLFFLGKNGRFGAQKDTEKKCGERRIIKQHPVMKDTYWSSYSATLTNLLAIPPFSHILCYNDAKEEHLSYGAKENHDDQEGKRPFI